MKLSFVPGELYLDTVDGQFRVTLRGDLVFETRSEKKALSKYNSLRKSLEAEHPAADLTQEQRELLLSREIGERLVDDNHYRPQQASTKRKNTSRTFG